MLGLEEEEKKISFPSNLTHASSLSFSRRGGVEGRHNSGGGVEKAEGLRNGFDEGRACPVGRPRGSEHPEQGEFDGIEVVRLATGGSNERNCRRDGPSGSGWQDTQGQELEIRQGTRNKVTTFSISLPPFIDLVSSRS